MGGVQTNWTSPDMGYICWIVIGSLEIGANGQMEVGGMCLGRILGGGHGG